MNYLALILLATAADEPKPQSFAVTISAGKHDRVNELVRVPLVVAGKPRHGSAYDAAGKLLGPVAFTNPSLAEEPRKAPDGSHAVEAAFVLPRLEAGKSATVELRLDGEAKWDGKAVLSWKPGKASEVLVRGGSGDATQPVLGYQMPKLDESTPMTREATFKPFHEAYVDGKKVTKGVGGLFTHHRGLYYGFMKVTYGKDTVDIWHCKGKTHQAHSKILDTAGANPVLGRHRVAIDWNGVGGKTFATEERELTAVPLPGGTLIEFVSKLTPTGDDVKLDGDPQHAGFHFRASNDVDKAKAETFFIRPDGIGAKGKETNWPGNKKHVDLPWLGMSFVIGGERYTAGYLDHPGNPKEARFSERTYGRFGSYFVTTVTKEKPLVVRYRVWLQKGETKPEALEALSKSFVDPVSVKVAAK